MDEVGIYPFMETGFGHQYEVVGLFFWVVGLFYYLHRSQVVLWFFHYSRIIYVNDLLFLLPFLGLVVPPLSPSLSSLLRPPLQIFSFWSFSGCKPGRGVEGNKRKERTHHKDMSVKLHHSRWYECWGTFSFN